MSNVWWWWWWRLGYWRRWSDHNESCHHGARECQNSVIHDPECWVGGDISRSSPTCCSSQVLILVSGVFWSHHVTPRIISIIFHGNVLKCEQWNALQLFSACLLAGAVGVAQAAPAAEAEPQFPAPFSSVDIGHIYLDIYLHIYAGARPQLRDLKWHSGHPDLHASGRGRLQHPGELWLVESGSRDRVLISDWCSRPSRPRR